MNFRKLFLVTLLPAALVLMSCGPKDVVNPVTPPSTHEGGGSDEPPTPPTPPSGDAVSMTVCTFNIRYANTSDKYSGTRTRRTSIPTAAARPGRTGRRP